MKTKLSNNMITAKEARNAIAVKEGHKDWETARCRIGADDLNELMIKAMEYYAEQSNSHKPVVSGKRLSCQKECGNTQPAPNGLICLNCGSSLKAVCVCGAVDKTT